MDKTTYHRANGKIWKIQSGTDFGEVWELDVFEDHADEYDPRRDEEGDLEILEADLRNRGYKVIKNNETDEFHFMFYVESDDHIGDPASYVDEIWEREIDTMLTNTAQTKIELLHQLRNSDDKYKRRLSETI